MTIGDIDFKFGTVTDIGIHNKITKTENLKLNQIQEGGQPPS
jgi:hypothetical protein